MNIFSRLFRKQSAPPIPVSECSKLMVGWLKRRLDKNELRQLAEIADLRIESIDDEFLLTEEALIFHVALAEQFFPRAMPEQRDSAGIVAGFLDRVSPVVKQFNARQGVFEVRYLKKRDEYKRAFSDNDSVARVGELFSRDLSRLPDLQSLGALHSVSLGLVLMKSEEQLQVMGRQFAALKIDRSRP